MQVTGIGIAWILAIGSFALLASVIAYSVMMLHSHQRIGQLQRAKLDEVSRSEEKYRGLFDNSLAGMLKFRIDDWTILDSNAAVRAMLGCTTQEELQECLLRLPEPARDSIFASLTRDGIVEQYEIRTSRRSGETLYILFSARTVACDGSAQAVVIDVTERMRQMEKIQEQRALLDHAQDAILVIDTQGQVMYWNSGAEMMYGWTKEEVNGRRLDELLYASANSNCFEEAMEDIRQFKEWNGEHRHIRKDGREIIVDSRWKTVERGSNTEQTVMIVSSDVSEKKRLESQFIRAQKMESIALLTGGLAHDLQNVLAPIAMSAHLLKKRLSGKSSLAIMRAVEKSARSGIELVQSILTYGRGIIGERKHIQVGRMLVQVLDAVRHGQWQNVRIERKLKAKRWPVSGDSNQLKQVFRNLCVNALESMPQGGLLTVESSDVVLEGDRLDEAPNAETSHYVLVSVSDAGVGIPHEDLDKIFEPFFTTKERTGGTGLGLSVAYGIVKSHGGFIKVESAMGSGTTFHVYLPAVSEKSD